FDDSFQAHSLRESKGAAEPHIQVDKVEPRAGVAADERSVHSRSGGGALDGGRPSRDVERQGRVILDHGAQLKAMANVLPNVFGRICGSLCRAIEDKPIALVVVGPSIVLPDVVVINRRAEEELSDI